MSLQQHIEDQYAFLIIGFYKGGFKFVSFLPISSSHKAICYEESFIWMVYTLFKLTTERQIKNLVEIG